MWWEPLSGPAYLVHTELAYPGLLTCRSLFSSFEFKDLGRRDSGDFVFCHNSNAEMKSGWVIKTKVCFIPWLSLKVCVWGRGGDPQMGLEAGTRETWGDILGRLTVSLLRLGAGLVLLHISLRLILTPSPNVGINITISQMQK